MWFLCFQPKLPSIKISLVGSLNRSEFSATVRRKLTTPKVSRKLFKTPKKCDPTQPTEIANLEFQHVQDNPPEANCEFLLRVRNASAKRQKEMQLRQKAHVFPPKRLFPEQ